MLRTNVDASLALRREAENGLKDQLIENTDDKETLELLGVGGYQ